MITLASLMTDKERAQVSKVGYIAKANFDAPAEIIKKSFVDLTIGDFIYLNQYDIFEWPYTNLLIQDLYTRFEKRCNEIKAV